MSGAQIRHFCGILLAFLAVQVVLTVLTAGVRFTRHEGDMMHLAELILRIAAGEVPHLDFMTPIGDLAVRPMAWALALLGPAGITGLGSAMLWGQLIVAAAILPGVAWTAASRMDFRTGIVFGVIVLGLVTGLVHGSSLPHLSLSMHYNRWCWALAWLVVVLTVVPAGRGRAAAVDGLVIGLCLAAMALIKASYAVALVLPVVLGLLVQGRVRVLWVGLIAGLAVWAVYAIAFGIGFWGAYGADLLAVLRSDIRPFPSEPLRQVVFSPLNTPATLAGLAGALLVRREAREPGLTLLLMLPAFVYIAYQNFGNDPLWLVPLAACLLALAPRARPEAARPMALTALVALLLVIAPLGNILWSPIRHLTQPRDLFRPVLAARTGADLMVLKLRAGPPFAMSPFRPGPGVEPLRLAGETLPECKMEGGLIEEIEDEVAAFDRLGLIPGPQPYVADFQAPHWMFADLTPLPQAAPWYYAGLPGIGAARHLLVPDCPSKPAVRAKILGLIEAQGLPLRQVLRAEHFTVYAIGDAASAPVEDAE